MTIFFKSCLSTAVLVILNPSAEVFAKEPTEKNEARIAYPRPFSRPPAMGKNYNTWADAQGPDIGQVKVVASRLPSRVDNSNRPEFPPIYKQKWGTCGQFTAVASIFTYETNVLNGTIADTDATRFPAHFSWNMMNQAQNQGSEAYHGWEVAKRLGIPTAKTYGGVRLDKIGVWPNGYPIWRDAMEYRVSGYRYTPANTMEQINEARGWLFDRNEPKKDCKKPGGLLALDGRMGELKEVTKTIPEGLHEAGEDVWISWGPTGYGHGITCVGYDDEVGFDVNGDGQITNDIDIDGDGQITLADWERGAFIVVNSWGKEWSKDGKIYLLYRAMLDPTWERGNFLGRIEVAGYQPQQTLKLKLACNDRSELRVTIGIASSPEAVEPEHEIAPEVLNGWPLFGKGGHVGKVPLAGPEDETPLEMGIDLTELFNKVGYSLKHGGRFFLRVSTADGSEARGELLECAIRKYDPKGTLLHEVKIEVGDGKFGPGVVQIEAVFP